MRAAVERVATRTLQWLPQLIVLAFFIRTTLVLFAPFPMQSERLWLEWLGSAILHQHAIPRTLGHEALVGFGNPYIVHEWFFAVFLHFCATHALDGPAILFVACCASVPMYVTERRLRAGGADRAAMSMGLVFVGLTLSTQIQMRASLVAYAVFALVCAALPCRDRRQYLIPIAVLLLANVHAMVTVLAFLPTGVWLCEFVSRRRFDADSRRLALVSFTTIIASACSPFGFSIYAYASSLGQGTHKYISEWNPILADLKSVIAQSDLLTSLICGGLLLAWVKHRPLRIAEWMPLAISGLLMLSSERFATLFIIAAAPLAFRNGFRTPNAPLVIINAPVAVAAIAFFAFVPNIAGLVHRIVTNPKLTFTGRPGLLVPALWLEPRRIGDPARERVDCSSFAHCNAYLFAGARVLLDGRADPYPINAYETTIFINMLRPGWLSELYRLDINVLVVERSLLALDAAMRHAPGWHKAAETDESVTYVRD